MPEEIDSLTQPSPFTRQENPDMLAEHARLTARIAEIDAAVSAAGGEREEAETERREALDRAMRARNAIEQRFHARRDSDAEQEYRRALSTDPDLIAADTDADRARQRIEQASARVQALMDERKTLVAERYTLSPGSLADLLELQEAIERERSEVARLHARIAQHAACPPAEPPDVGEINVRISEAMAAVELGEIPEKDLAALEKERASAMKAKTKALDEIENGALLARGLEERLNAAAERLDELRANGRTALAHHVRAEFERVKDAYGEEARRLFETHGRLMALARIATSADPEVGREVTNRHGALLRFALGLVDADGATLPDDRQRRERAVSEELERLGASGIRLLD